MTKLFQPLQVGALNLPNRVIMAPLTRCRASAGRVPNSLMRDYYVQRSGAGMILTEATSISPRGVGYPNTPGIWSEAQVDGWKMITNAVHEAGGRILLQLWHVGRISHPSYLEGQLPVAPSAIAAKGHVSLVRPMQPLPTPHPLTADEISETIEDYRKAAQNALEAGFDGVELHAANGYLIDQFLQDSTNHREDQYGGPVKNRVRFLTEVLDAVLTVWEPGRVGVHLAPKGDTHDMGDSDLEGLFLHVARELGARKIAFICARESYDGTEIGPKLKEAFGGVYVANQGFTRESAQSTLASDGADAVAWGKLFIANPDLPHRFEVGSELNEPDPATFYAAEGTEPEPGYIDYPPLESERKLAHKG